jgi:hypothetical protein
MMVHLDLVPAGNETSNPIGINKYFPYLSPLTNIDLANLYQSMIDQLQANPPQLLQGTTSTFQLIAVRYSVGNDQKLFTVRVPFLGDPLTLPPPMPRNGEHVVGFLTRYEIIQQNN